MWVSWVLPSISAPHFPAIPAKRMGPLSFRAFLSFGGKSSFHLMIKRRDEKIQPRTQHIDDTVTSKQRPEGSDGVSPTNALHPMTLNFTGSLGQVVPNSFVSCSWNCNWAAKSLVSSKALCSWVLSPVGCSRTREVDPSPNRTLFRLYYSRSKFT